MSSLHVTLAGSEHVVEAGTTAGAALPAEPGVIAARINGELRDLDSQLADGDVVEPVDIASDDGRYILRHSAAHVMAQAVQQLFPQAKLVSGRRWRTASTTTSTWTSRSPRRT